MAKIIVLSDIHGNLAALEAAWRDIGGRPFDALYCLGDLAAFGPEPDETITYLREEIQPTATIAGNTDRYLVEKKWKKSKGEVTDLQRALEWCHGRLSKDNREWLAELPATHTEVRDGTEIELLHGGPDDDELRIGTMAGASALAEAFGKHGPGVSFCGHTHIPFRERVADRDVINVGSVGFPFDGDTRAAYVCLKLADGGIREVETRRVAYSLDRTVANLRETGAPMAEILVRRLRFGELESA